MIWLTWRQFRIQAIVAAVTLAVAAVALALNGRMLAQLYTDSGAAACPATGRCAALANFLADARSGPTAVLFILGAALLYLVPPLIGVFWGAPLVARELEAGTHRLVWNQSVTRDRWLGVKLAVLGAASMAFAGLLSVVVWWSSSKMDGAALDRITPLMFGARGIVPIGYAAFAFVLGVAAGILLRRTVPAMAATLAAYAGVTGAMVLWGRGHLLPAKHLSVAFDSDNPTSLHIGSNGRIDVESRPNLPGAWIVGNQTVTPSGQPFAGQADPQVCGPAVAPQKCMDWLATLNLQQSLTYQPASRFWALQWAETGVFLALAALLVGFGFWWLRRRSA